MSGSWLAIVQGFAGMRTWNETLSFNPKLPDQWSSYSFNINYREYTLKVIVEKENIFIENMSEGQVELVVYGESYKIEDKLTIKREENLSLSM